MAARSYPPRALSPNPGLWAVPPGVTALGDLDAAEIQADGSERNVDARVRSKQMLDSSVLFSTLSFIRLRVGHGRLQR